VSDLSAGRARVLRLFMTLTLTRVRAQQQPRHNVQMKQMEKQHGGSRWASAGRKGGGKGEDKEDGEFVDESRFTVFGESKYLPGSFLFWPRVAWCPSIDLVVLSCLAITACSADSDEEDKGAKGAKAGGGKKDKDEDVGEEKEDIDFEETWDDDEGGTIDEVQTDHSLSLLTQCAMRARDGLNRSDFMCRVRSRRKRRRKRRNERPRTPPSRYLLLRRAVHTKFVPGVADAGRSVPCTRTTGHAEAHQGLGSARGR
jgi:hypothetical protein